MEQLLNQLREWVTAKQGRTCRVHSSESFPGGMIITLESGVRGISRIISPAEMTSLVDPNLRAKAAVEEMINKLEGA